MASVNYKVPPVFTAQKPYSRWIDEIKAWKALTDLDKKKMGVAIALSLPEEGLSSIRDKVFSDLSLDELNSDDGVDKLIEFMDKIFKKDELSEAYESYTEFDRFRRSKVGSMEDYVMEFEKLYNKTKKFNMELPQAVLAFKLLEYSELEMKDRQLVLTGVNYTDVGSLFKQMTTSLKKFFGQQANRDMEDGIKVESACMANEDVNYSRNRFGRPRGGGFRGHQFSNRANDHKPQGNFNYKPKYNKSFNPNGPDGLPLRCLSCDSIRHLVKQCPHSYENMEKTKQGFEKAVLFTGNKSHEALVLLTESANSAVLDSACTSTVAGETWMKCYLDSLDPSIREKIVETPSDTLFKFGGGTVLQSAKKVKIPCAIAGVECEILADVVTSDIPLLLSKDSMKKAKMKLDLENDSASIFGKDVDLQCTSSGHYCIPIDQVKVDVNITASALISTQMTKDKTEVIEKLHKQFAHPSAKRLKTLLKDAGGYTEEHLNCVDHVTEGCDVCKRYKKTPARPVVSLPLATEYNEVVAIDLKIWKPNIYFLHMVDIATRFSLATVIRKKTPEVIADKIMALWIGSGMGPPKRFLADNGGEFANEIFRDMCANLNIEVINTAAYSPWQNGICERNHAVVDDCVAKILEDQPKLNLEIALVWAVNAKNSLSMVYGWSPYQLVFGANPNLPSVLVDKPPALEYNTVSQTFANHLNALHSGRRAFIQAESSERIRRALRHKIRASGVCYQHGDGDRLLAELLIAQKDVVVSYHEHDSLLQSMMEEDLTEEERRAAWVEYEAEKKGLWDAVSGTLGPGQSYFDISSVIEAIMKKKPNASQDELNADVEKVIIMVKKKQQERWAQQQEEIRKRQLLQLQLQQQQQQQQNQHNQQNQQNKHLQQQQQRVSIRMMQAAYDSRQPTHPYHQTQLLLNQIGQSGIAQSRIPNRVNEMLSFPPRISSQGVRLPTAPSLLSNIRKANDHITIKKVETNKDQSSSSSSKN
ncbi:Retrovirus-related Pol polyprotein [Nymphon striatum]|nr:Retrovirus-related Pol polyprotein [Nymphon striatum]